MEKEISHYDYSVSRNLTTTYFTDGTFDTAAGDVRPVVESNNEEATLTNRDHSTAIDIQLGFYKILEPIPYTDGEGNVTGETEVGSIQEVPVDLGDSWVAEGLAEVAEDPGTEEVQEATADQKEETKNQK